VESAVVKTFLVKFPAVGPKVREDQTENRNLWRWDKICPA